MEQPFPKQLQIAGTYSAFGSKSGSDWVIRGDKNTNQLNHNPKVQHQNVSGERKSSLQEQIFG